MRRGLVWGVVVPVMLVGSQAAHALVYRLVYPQAHVRALVLFATGHGYLTWLPIVLAIAGASLAASLLVVAVDGARGREARGLPPAAFALLPALTFALQELLELSLHTGTFGWRVVLAPTFLPGLALQLPFGAVAYVVARLLLRAARAAGRALAPPPSVRVVASTVPAPNASFAPRPRVAAVALAKRGPPLLADA
ncbi:MAG TPA: hypothetical protein VKC62_11050 [Gaiellaceae bacterium]|nr:hypothetical protein [Gaiellaceae bacterium]